MQKWPAKADALVVHLDQLLLLGDQLLGHQHLDQLLLGDQLLGDQLLGDQFRVGYCMHQLLGDQFLGCWRADVLGLIFCGSDIIIYPTLRTVLNEKPSGIEGTAGYWVVYKGEKIIIIAGGPPPRPPSLFQETLRTLSNFST